MGLPVTRCTQVCSFTTWAALAKAASVAALSPTSASMETLVGQFGHKRWAPGWMASTEFTMAGNGS